MNFLCRIGSHQWEHGVRYMKAHEYVGVGIWVRECCRCGSKEVTQ